MGAGWSRATFSPPHIEVKAEGEGVGDGNYYYVCDPAGSDVFGAPAPVQGVRVVFDPARLAAYGVGDQLPLVHRARGPQGLVVFSTPLDAQTWPCRLWRVGELRDPVRPWSNSYYLRCHSFLVRAELPSWLVFGPRGEEVAGVIDRAGRLSQADVDVLAGLADEEEKRAYSAVFARWKRRRETGDVREGSLRPAGGAITAALRAVDRAARRADTDLFGWTDAARDEPVLADPAWLRARRAVHAAVLGLGASDASAEESQTLMWRWRTVDRTA
jgi:hypothetical protein